uniref:B box-type domain-containing protein n=1 Tax=Rhizophora mucronata TaxID=61149 RepID=A0A2P2J868_RHIMU
MVSRQQERKEGVPCDFCCEHMAVLYCRADSAKLCLFCDQHVHSANLLSRKHVRSQICDNCGTEPVAVRCDTDKLVLCQECDCDAHGSCSVSAAHDRTPVEGFSGCPSAPELASLWGFNLNTSKSHQSPPPPPPPLIRAAQAVDLMMQIDPWGFQSAGASSFQDLMVPNDNGIVLVNRNVNDGGEIYSVSKRQQSPNCGKYKQVLHKQLVELFKRDLMPTGDGGCDGEGENMVRAREMPSRSTWQGDMEGAVLGNGNVAVISTEVSADRGAAAAQQQRESFSSLLTLPSQLESKPSGRATGGDMPWNSGANKRGTQIWDFNLGQSRNHDEYSELEIGYGSNNGGFLMKHIDEFMGETSMMDAKVWGDIYQINCAIANEDMVSFGNNLHNPTASQGPATSESNKLHVARRTTGLNLGKHKGPSSCKDIHFMEQAILVGNESMVSAAGKKIDMEQLAHNRGHAMQRYKEKKKKPKVCNILLFITLFGLSSYKVANC